MPQLQSSSSEHSDNPKFTTDNGTSIIPSVDDFSFKDRALHIKLSHTLSTAHHHREAFHAAWIWSRQQDCYMYSADMARLLISKFKTQNSAARDQGGSVRCSWLQCLIFPTRFSQTLNTPRQLIHHHPTPNSKNQLLSGTNNPQGSFCFFLRIQTVFLRPLVPLGQCIAPQKILSY